LSWCRSMRRPQQPYGNGRQLASAARAITVPLPMTSLPFTGTSPRRTMCCHGAARNHPTSGRRPKIYGARRPGSRKGARNGSGTPHTFQPDKAHHQDHVRPGTACASAKKLAKSWFCQSSMLGDNEVANVRRNSGEAAETDRRTKARWRLARSGTKGCSLRSRIPECSDGNAECQAERTTRSGQLRETMPPTASAAKTNACTRLRCGISNPDPVAISSPAAAAETPPRMF